MGPKNQRRKRAIPYRRLNDRLIEAEPAALDTAALLFPTTFPEFDAVAYRASASG